MNPIQTDDQIIQIVNFVQNNKNMVLTVKDNHFSCAERIGKIAYALLTVLNWISFGAIRGPKYSAETTNKKSINTALICRNLHLEPSVQAFKMRLQVGINQEETSSSPTTFQTASPRQAPTPTPLNIFTVRGNSQGQLNENPFTRSDSVYIPYRDTHD